MTSEKSCENNSTKVCYDFDIDECLRLWDIDMGESVTEEDIRKTYNDKIQADLKNMAKLAQECEKEVKALNSAKTKKRQVSKDMLSVEYLRNHLYKLDNVLGIFRKGILRKYCKKAYPYVFSLIPKELFYFFETDRSCPEYTLISDIHKEHINTKNRTINEFPELAFNSLEGEHIENAKFKTVMEFLKVRVCDDKEDVFEWLCNYISHLAQNKRTNILLYLFGDEGIGKSMFVDFLCKMVGKPRCRDVKIQEVAKDFSSFLENSQILRIEETSPSNGKNPVNSEGMARLRNICTATYETIRKMYTDPYEMAIFCNVVFCSNHLPPQCDAKGRRMFFLHLKQLRLAGEKLQKYWETMGKILLDEDVVKNMFLYFKNRKITMPDLQKSADKFESDIKYDMKASKTPTELWMENLVRSRTLEKKYKQTDLYNEYKDNMEKKKQLYVSYALFGVFLTNLETSECLEKHRMTSGTYIVFNLDNMTEKYKKSDEEIEYEKERDMNKSKTALSVFDNDTDDDEEKAKSELMDIRKLLTKSEEARIQALENLAKLQEQFDEFKAQYNKKDAKALKVDLPPKWKDHGLKDLNNTLKLFSA